MVDFKRLDSDEFKSSFVYRPPKDCEIPPVVDKDSNIKKKDMLEVMDQKLESGELIRVGMFVKTNPDYKK